MSNFTKFYEDMLTAIDDLGNSDITRMSCPSCFKDVDDGSKFCHNCGGQLEIDAVSDGSNSFDYEDDNVTDYMGKDTEDEVVLHSVTDTDSDDAEALALAQDLEAEVADELGQDGIDVEIITTDMETDDGTGHEHDHSEHEHGSIEAETTSDEESRRKALRSEDDEENAETDEARLAAVDEDSAGFGDNEDAGKDGKRKSKSKRGKDGTDEDELEDGEKHKKPKKPKIEFELVEEPNFEGDTEKDGEEVKDEEKVK